MRAQLARIRHRNAASEITYVEDICLTSRQGNTYAMNVRRLARSEVLRMSQKRHFYMVLATPKKGREADWKEWHGTQHVYDMLRVPGIVSCQRFELGPWQANAKGRNWRFMALYEIESDNVEAVIEEVRCRLGGDLMPATDASDPANTATILWLPLSEHHAHEIQGA